MEIKVLTVCLLNYAQNQFTLPYSEIFMPSLCRTRFIIDFRFTKTLIVWSVAIVIL